MSAAPLPLRDVVAACRSPYVLDELTGAGEAPVLVVEVDGVPLDVQTTGTLRSLPLVVVAVGPGADALGRSATAFDVALGTDVGIEDPLARLEAGVAANPIASVALVQLLRMSEHLDVTEGLVAESLTYSMLQTGPEFANWLVSRPATGDKPVNPVPLLKEREGAELRLEFCRPEIRNAFGFEVRDALVEALQLAAADDSIERVVLRGEGPSFCSGGDLREFGTTTDPASAHLIRTMRSAGYWLHRTSSRLLAEIHGDCIGSGIELPAFACRVSAVAPLRVRLPEISMGLVPGAGGTVSLPRRIGRHRTNLLALSGATIETDTALRWHLVDDYTSAP